MEKEYTLVNERVSCAFLPWDGGRLISIKDKASAREYIWNNQRTMNLFRYYGANYDNMSAGGVEEAYPTGLADVFREDEIPFFGEVWAIPWKVIWIDDSHLKMECYSAIYPVILEKEYVLEGSLLSCEYKLTNLGASPVPGLFGIHPSLRLDAGDRITIPSKRYAVGVGKHTDNTLKEGSTFQWPFDGKRDLTGFADNGYEEECIEFRNYHMEQGYLGILCRQGGLMIQYDTNIFPTLSVWLINGGWRGHRCLMAEFFTGYPFILSEADKNGRCPWVLPQNTITTTVTYKLLGKV